MPRTLLDSVPPHAVPLAERMRPRTLDDVVGQEELLGPGKPLRVLAEQRHPASLILWGPPGTGKTTLARLIASTLHAEIVEFSGVQMGVKDVREVAQFARERERPTLLFVDEIHRLNKAQQDAFLPHVEAGTFHLLGATTENPSFSVIAPLLSRSRVFVLRSLTPEQIGTIIDRAVASKDGLGGRVALDAEARAFLTEATGGDARSALGALEFAAEQTGAGTITRAALEQALQRRLPLHDRGGEAHYNVVSAFIKSLRGSDPDAALYYMARMLEAGEDPRFVARRMVILASEDVGTADPHALTLAVAAAHAVDLIGMPECRINLAEACTYLALAPKSNASYMGLEAAYAANAAHPGADVPLHLRNAPTKLMKELGYHAGYQYDHDAPGGISQQGFLPDGVAGGFYQPKDVGAETRLKARWEEIRQKRRKAPGG